MIVRPLSSHIINCSLTHSLTHSINRSINRWIQRYVTHIKFHIILWPQGKCPADLRAYLSEIQWYLINTFLLIRYCCKLPRYICFIQPCWTKKISGICIIRIISIIFFLKAEADFKCYLYIWMHRFFISIILSEHKMSMSSLSGSLDMFIISCCLIKRSLQTLESENNYTFTQRWSGWREKQVNHLKSKQKKQKNPLFSSLV